MKIFKPSRRKALKQQTINADQIYKRIETKYLIDENQKEVFYRSEDWQSAKFFVYENYEKVCFCCYDTKQLQIDHIKPLSLFPEKCLDIFNLQILCKTCNQLKSNRSKKKFKRLKKNQRIKYTVNRDELKRKWMKYFPLKNKFNVITNDKDKKILIDSKLTEIEKIQIILGKNGGKRRGF